jgi:transcriptional regulator with XRE-family HTH domain
MELERLAKELRRARAAERLVQADVAAKLGMSRQRYGRLEHGVGEILAQEVPALAAFLGLGLEDVITLGTPA